MKTIFLPKRKKTKTFVSFNPKYRWGVHFFDIFEHPPPKEKSGFQVEGWGLRGSQPKTHSGYIYWTK